MMDRSHDTTLAEIGSAVDGLRYPSESDEPIEVFACPAAPGEALRQAVERVAPEQRPVVEQSAEEFFGDLADADDADRFRELRETLERRTQGLAVVRAGRVQVHVYVAGRAGERWAGVRTLSIET